LSELKDIRLNIEGREVSFCGMVDATLKSQSWGFSVEGEFETIIVDDRKPEVKDAK